MNNKILRLLFKFETEYKGYSLYVAGNALRHALGMVLNASIGIFTSLKKLYYPVNYEEFFLPRISKEVLKPYKHNFFSKHENKKQIDFYYKPYAVAFDLIKYPENLIEYINDKKVMQLGGGRNKGYGLVSLQDYVIIDLDDIVLPDKGTHIVLISSFLRIPNYVHSYNCRYSFEQLWNNGIMHMLKIVPPGQFFRIREGKNIKKIAEKGILRKTIFGGFGFGEFQIHNWEKKQ